MRHAPFVRSTLARVVTGLVAVVATTLGSAVLAPGSAQAADQRATVRTVSSMGTTYAADVLRYTNRYRVAHGRRPLARSSCLTGFASRWTAHMAARTSLVHQGLRPVLRECHSRRAAENIAMSGSAPMSAAAVVRAWIHSPEHRANILDGRLRYLGVAAYRSAGGRVYVTQDFAG